MAEKRHDVIALGELLMDMTNNGVTERNNTLYEANPGGAPGNVLAMLRRFEHRVAMVGKVGKDMFGDQLIEILDDLGIGTDNVISDPDSRTTLAFVKTFEDGDRDFSFYRNPGADMMLTEADLNLEVIRNTKIFHFGTLSMTHAGVREATLRAVREAKNAGALISFDPNLRPPLWSSLDYAREQVLEGMKYCDFLKISDNEIVWLTGKDDFGEGVKQIRQRFDIPLITVSAGKNGSIAYYKDAGREDDGLIVEAPAFLQDQTIETTGAGDTFCGCILHFLLTKGIRGLNENDLKEMLLFANAAASVITTRNGALRVMPTLDEIDALMNR